MWSSLLSTTWALFGWLGIAVPSFIMFNIQAEPLTAALGAWGLIIVVVASARGTTFSIIRPTFHTW